MNISVHNLRKNYLHNKDLVHWCIRKNYLHDKDLVQYFIKYQASIKRSAERFSETASIMANRTGQNR